MQKINTSVNTGDRFIYNNQEYIVGTFRKIDGKKLITLKIMLSEVSSTSIFVSTRKLNEMLKTSEIISKK